MHRGEFERAINFEADLGIFEVISDRECGACQQAGALRSVGYAADDVFCRVE
ncbi:hypothetical protein G8O24_17480 [Bradyrhizobium sp. INPA01-394B]|uniref:Uncharacterized protein n=1 Tax=Bradyrhizobium campsiandrae TaxID=1729892 RepID=A0ABR7UG52_9BRAD|nr:hypothetical protein [Bradyrhizobium campsiandrae]MBC9879135.1 hypothetical protein [Bradyrhizobium campsiandrae]MBC9983081.1 hypothetical protein [Bradyrhizobium campsiandrae]